MNMTTQESTLERAILVAGRATQLLELAETICERLLSEVVKRDARIRRLRRALSEIDVAYDGGPAEIAHQALDKDDQSL